MNCYAGAMTRRRNFPLRCKACRMHMSLCVCAAIVPQQTVARLCLVLHREEAKRTTNTGRIAAMCLKNSHVVIHGIPHQPTLAPNFEGTRPMLLWPSLGATPLADVPPLDADGRAITLVVPDGNWRQASRMSRRIQWLTTLPRVTLPAGAPSTYRLRNEPQSDGLATIEAIARAFGVMERDRGPSVQAEMERVMRLMVDRTLFSRGVLPRSEVFGGIPDHVQIHLPGGPAVDGEPASDATATADRTPSDG